MFPVVTHYSEILEQSMFGNKHPTFPQEGLMESKVVRWLRALAWSVWDIFVPGSYARAVYERIHEMALIEFKKARISNPEETWKSMSARVALANLTKQMTYSWKIVALYVAQMSSIGWVMHRAQYGYVSKTVLSHTMRRLAKSPHGESLLNKYLLMEVLHLIVPSEQQWPYIHDVEPFSSEIARSSFWEHLFCEPCPNRTWEDFDNQLIARLSQNVELLSGIVRDIPTVDFEWLCQNLFRPVHQHLAASRRANLGERSVRYAESWTMITEHKIDWLALAEGIEPGISLNLGGLSSSLQALAMAVYLSIGKEGCVDRKAWLFITRLVASSKGWARYPQLLASLMDYLEGRDLNPLKSLDALWSDITGQNDCALSVTPASVAYDIADMFFIDKWLQGAHRAYKGIPGWSKLLEIPFILTSMRIARNQGESLRLPLKVESWLLLISLYGNQSNTLQPFTRFDFYAFIVGHEIDFDEIRELHAELWIDRLLGDALRSLDGGLYPFTGEVSISHLWRLRAWSRLVELGLSRERAREVLKNNESIAINFIDFEKSFVASSIPLGNSFEFDWDQFHPDCYVLFSQSLQSIDKPIKLKDALIIKERLLAYCNQNKLQVNAALKYISQMGISPFKSISDAINVKLALANEQSPGVVLSEQEAYTFHFSFNKERNLILGIYIHASSKHRMSGYVKYEVEANGQIKANDIFFNVG